jgi:hypothetical protein
MALKLHVKQGYNIRHLTTHKNGTAAAWTRDNPILSDGEIGLEQSSTTPKFKVGDGVTHWNDLPYVGGGTTSTVPTGTGYRHVTAGIEDAATSYPARPPGCQWESKTAIDVTQSTPVDVYMPYACTITGVVVMTQGGTGSCVIDILSAAFPTVPTVSICASAKPTISTGTTYSDTTLTGWTTTVAAGTRLRFTLSSSSTFKKISIFLKVS